MDVPYEFHRYIIGAKGVGVRQLMDEFDVNIKVPSSDLQSNIIVITGTPKNVEEARKGLLERVSDHHETIREIFSLITSFLQRLPSWRRTKLIVRPRALRYRLK